MSKPKIKPNKHNKIPKPALSPDGFSVGLPAWSSCCCCRRGPSSITQKFYGWTKIRTGRSIPVKVNLCRLSTPSIICGSHLIQVCTSSSHPRIPSSWGSVGYCAMYWSFSRPQGLLLYFLKTLTWLALAFLIRWSLLVNERDSWRLTYKHHSPGPGPLQRKDTVNLPKSNQRE